MRRREFIALSGGTVAWPLVALAQQHGKLQRIGLLIPVSETSAGANVGALLRGLRDLGYVQGLNVALEYRYANGKDNLLPGFATELVQAGVNVIVTWGTPVARAAKQETSKIPIVMAAIADPIETTSFRAWRGQAASTNSRNG
jgi:putative tryptophan/tyrosine transport system substrate-binding protein